MKNVPTLRTLYQSFLDFFRNSELTVHLLQLAQNHVSWSLLCSQTHFLHYFTCCLPSIPLIWKCDCHIFHPFCIRLIALTIWRDLCSLPSLWLEFCKRAFVCSCQYRCAVFLKFDCPYLWLYRWSQRCILRGTVLMLCINVPACMRVGVWHEVGPGANVLWCSMASLQSPVAVELLWRVKHSTDLAIYPTHIRIHPSHTYNYSSPAFIRSATGSQASAWHFKELFLSISSLCSMLILWFFYLFLPFLISSLDQTWKKKWLWRSLYDHLGEYLSLPWCIVGLLKGILRTCGLPICKSCSQL